MIFKNILPGDLLMWHVNSEFTTRAAYLIVGSEQVDDETTRLLTIHSRGGGRLVQVHLFSSDLVRGDAWLVIRNGERVTE